MMNTETSRCLVSRSTMGLSGPAPSFPCLSAACQEAAENCYAGKGNTPLPQGRLAPPLPQGWLAPRDGNTAGMIGTQRDGWHSEMICSQGWLHRRDGYNAGMVGTQGWLHHRDGNWG